MEDLKIQDSINNSVEHPAPSKRKRVQVSKVKLAANKADVKAVKIGFVADKAKLIANRAKLVISWMKRIPSQPGEKFFKITNILVKTSHVVALVYYLIAISDHFPPT